MGCAIGKNIGQKQNISVDGIDIVRYDTKQTRENREVENIKKQLEKYPERFILNNLLMCFVFFENYETDLYDFSNTNIPKDEQNLDVKLKREVKKCILPDVLLDKIQKNIIFLREHTEETKDQDGNITKTKSMREEYLTSKIMYLVNNNIEVTLIDNGNEYTPIAVPGCSVVVEEIMEQLGGRLLVQDASEQSRKTQKLEKYGFLRLRVTANSSKNIGNDLLEDRTETKPQKLLEPIPGTSKEELTPENEEYSDIIAFNTPRNINIRETDGRRETLPNDCFHRRKIKNVDVAEEKKWEIDIQDEESSDDDDESDSEEETKNGDNEMNNTETEKKTQHQNKSDTELFEEITYLSSTGFLEYFQAEVFPNTVGRLLGFTKDEIENSQLFPGYITCNKEHEYKIIPAVAIDWPQQAKEFTNRKTRKLYDKKNKKYEWPTEDMVEELKALNCVVIPKGFVDKKDVNNPDSSIEWEIHFPKAERFLEMRLAHAQVKCYIILIALFKTFIEKATAHRGLLMEHLRTHLFWECEKDAILWPEHKMGIKILKVIEDLNSGLSKRNIPDFFIKKKNIFQNIPSMYIQFAQKVFHDILQFPVMHFLEALKNLRYNKSDFYPFPDLDLLEYILTSDDIVLPKKTKTPSFLRSKIRKPKKKEKVSFATGPASPRKAATGNRDLNWKKRMEKHNRKIHLKQMIAKKAQEAKAAKAMEESRDLKINFEDLEILRQRALLQFFIKQFIEIAKKSRQIGPLNQARFYINRARCNWRALVDLVGSSDDTANIEEAINNEENEIDNMLEKSSAHEDIAPPTPRRNPTNAPNFIRPKSENIVIPINYIPGKSEVSSIMKSKNVVKEKRVRGVVFDDNIDGSAC